MKYMRIKNYYVCFIGKIESNNGYQLWILKYFIINYILLILGIIKLYNI